MKPVGKALMFMAKNEDDRVDRFIMNVLISKALLLYLKKQYKDAIKIIWKQSSCTDAAHSCYHLGAVEKAREVMRYTAGFFRRHTSLAVSDDERINCSHRSGDNRVVSKRYAMPQTFELSEPVTI
ncbi:hypothetical protein PsorP6_001968 [Peronosclerospora sorghi]|uniref:Uncharacterized protein n=1 Tax=Peronosclerospora sorghi TaxID=230839 RepID=A0ACC0WU47_9STRA|nr:hypothetical protein PsorP6_001968 [Peronosclerospora sorghi]